MTETVLTPRGEKVVGFLFLAAIVVGFFALMALAGELTTPEECKVPVEQMSRACTELLFP